MVYLYPDIKYRYLQLFQCIVSNPIIVSPYNDRIGDNLIFLNLVDNKYDLEYAIQSIINNGDAKINIINEYGIIIIIKQR